MHDRTRRHLQAVAHSSSTSQPTTEPEPVPRSVWLTGQVCSRDQRRSRYLHASLAHPGKMLPSIARYLIATYRACWRDPAGRQRCKTFRTKREAGAFLAEVDSALNRGTYVATDAGRLRFGDYATRWLSARNHERATAARDVSIMRNHVLPQWGGVPSSKIEHSAVRAWVTELGQRLSPASVRECHR